MINRGAGEGSSAEGVCPGEALAGRPSPPLDAIHPAPLSRAWHASSSSRGQGGARDMHVPALLQHRPGAKVPTPPGEQSAGLEAVGKEGLRLTTALPGPQVLGEGLLGS